MCPWATSCRQPSQEIEHTNRHWPNIRHEQCQSWSVPLPEPTHGLPRVDRVGVSTLLSNRRTYLFLSSGRAPASNVRSHTVLHPILGWDVLPIHDEMLQPAASLAESLFHASNVAQTYKKSSASSQFVSEEEFQSGCHGEEYGRSFSPRCNSALHGTESLQLVIKPPHYLSFLNR